MNPTELKEQIERRWPGQAQCGFDRLDFDDRSDVHAQRCSSKCAVELSRSGISVSRA